MKVTKWYEPPGGEIEVEITAEEISQALAEETDSVSACLRGLNNCAGFLRAIRPGMIELMGDKQREIIRGFLKEQAARF